MKKFREYLIEDKPRPKILNELFVQLADIAKIPNGNQRDIEILRLGIIAELDAANLYESLAKQTVNSTLQEMLRDIANEEKAHIGEFEALLEELDPDHETYEDEGEEEAEEKFGIGKED
jgi:rubrerythrin